MAGGINISIGSDEKDFLRGVKNSAASLDDLGDTLQDIDRAGSKAGGSLEQDFKIAQKATKSFTDSVKDGEDALRKTASVSRSATREIAGDFELTAGQQKTLRKKALGEIKQEAKANAAETFSSFDGSAASFADGIQGTLGGLVSSLGPLGLAAGAAGALAIGYINGALQKADTTSQAFKQSVAEMTTELIKSGDIGSVSVGYIVDQLKKLATETDSGKASLSKLNDLAKGSGNTYKDLAQAYAGNVDGLHKVVKEGKSKLDQDTRQAIALSRLSTEEAKASTGSATAYADTLRRKSAQEKLNKSLEEAEAKAVAAAEATELYAAAGGPELEEKAALIGQINTAYDDAAGAVDAYVNKETGVLDVGKYIAAMAAKSQALKDYQDTLATSGLSTEAKSFLDAQGQDAAATFLAGYKSAAPAQKAELARLWTEAGSTSSGAYANALTAGIPKTIPGPVIIPQIDFSGIKSFRELAVKPLKVPIYLADPRAGKFVP